jgi:DNA-binding transcriptional regulator YiaG
MARRRATSAKSRAAYRAKSAGGDFAADVADGLRGRRRQLKTGVHRIEYQTVVEGKRQTFTRTFRAEKTSIERRGYVSRVKGLEKKLGQKAVAKLIGVDSRTLRKWKSGQRVISQRSLKKLNKALTSQRRKAQRTLTGADSFLQSFYKTLQDYYKKFPRGTSPRVLSITRV